MTIDDPTVCQKGIAALLRALETVRDTRGETKGKGKGKGGSDPRIVVLSTCGISKAGWDFPVLTLPLYRLMLNVPHKDKKVLEARLAESGERYTIVRPSLLGDGEGEKKKKIRVGVEDWVGGVESKAVGYTISREDTGRWIYENLIEGREGTFENKIVSITW
ncbi:hypothetical protein F5B20DRAFT_518191 [Whalleya microplaca]|nr:hypothetical protein F5B20DRAFT_518191 [Whalleya microplaca]